MKSPSLVVVAVIVAGGSTLIRQTVKGGSGNQVRTIVGAWVLGLILMGVSEFSPDIASAFAILVMVSSLLVNGEAVFSATAKAVN